MNYGDFIPPIMFAAAKKLGFTKPRSRPEAMSQTYSSYNEALGDCANFGYEAGDVVEVVFRKTKAHSITVEKSLLLPTVGETLLLFALGKLADRPEPIKVLDFGGACGAHYFRIRAMLQNKVALHWHVVETSAMAKRAQELSTNSLKFFDSIENAMAAFNGQADIVHSSGVLQCVPSASECLEELLSCRTAYHVFARVGFNRGDEDVICIHESRLSHNGPGPMPSDIPDGSAKYPFIFPARHKIDDRIRQALDVILMVEDDSGVFPVNGEKMIGVGYVARKLERP